MSKLIISIDPAINNTGLAVWEERLAEPIRVESLATKGDTLEKGQQLFDWFDKQLLSFYNSQITLHIEYPKYFASSAKGQAAATQGDLGTTYMAAHICLCIGWEIGAKVTLVPVNVWKGQLSKRATVARIKRRLPNLVCKNSHEYDAVGIGLYVRGEF